MKYLVFSDSHGNRRDMGNILASEKADAVIYLGDGVDDIKEELHWFPGLGDVIVKGNCDIFRPGIPAERIIVSDGCTVVVCHGHLYDVKDGMYELESHGRSNRAAAILYGHTHIQEMHDADGMLVLNPGSVGYGGEYAVLTLENGRATAELKKAEGAV